MHNSDHKIARPKFDSVLFDVDSTLVTIEGLDFLADLKGLGEEIKQLTLKSMNGNLSMREAMKIKMQTISPSRHDLELMGEAYIKNLTPGVLDTIKILKNSGIDVWIVTGNFLPGVNILSRYLKIDEDKVLTNEIYFDNNGNYVGFDLDNPFSNDGGKAIVIKKYKEKMGNCVFIGDGSTDLDTKGVADLFIGFGGVVQRDKVKEFADIYIVDNDMCEILPYLEY